MRKELNVITGEITEHEDAPVTLDVSIEIKQPKPTVEQLQAQLADIAAKLQALQGAAL
jgi:hypothetical protein